MREREKERVKKERQAVPVQFRCVCLDAVANRHQIPYAHKTFETLKKRSLENDKYCLFLELLD